MKSWLFILILSCSGLYSSGQAYIKGRITDHQQNLPFATALLLDSDSSVVKGFKTDSTGEFVFENVAPGHYLVSSPMVGYSKFFSQPIRMEEKNITLPDIILKKTATGLDEVVVTTKKPFFEQKTDRLVVNVQRSITSSGSTILEVLQKSPGEKGTFRLAMDDIFNTNYWKIKPYKPQNNLDSYFKYNFHNRFIRLTYTRNSGNNKLRSVKLKSGSEEERGRVAN